ncbi:MAG: hypothetical protein HFE76_03890 [Firmicutes bacterium]|nr:hypothetical protein [Bacillota bacterium]
MALLLKYVVDKEKRDPAFITYLDKWEANIDGEIEKTAHPVARTARFFL